MPLCAPAKGSPYDSWLQSTAPCVRASCACGASRTSAKKRNADIGRFNEAIDQALAESIDRYVAEVDLKLTRFRGHLILCKEGLTFPRKTWTGQN